MFTKKKSKNKKLQERKITPDALMISTRGNTSYADILRKVKTDPKLFKIGKNVTKIRRTIKGELLLQLGKNDERTEDFRGLIGELLGESASVRTLKQRRTIETKTLMTSRRRMMFVI